MAELVLAVMLAAATLYALLAGADFGAGLIEPFLPAHERERIDVAIAPVWEANHVWLVLLATLAFVAFPPLYALITGYLHIPLLLVLLGIVARGSAFTFRHYDPEPGTLEHWYTYLFRFGSVLTPLFLGITLAATAHGSLRTDVHAGFYATYVAPWNTWFGWCTGLFVVMLFAFEGAALLAAEHADGRGALPYRKLARATHVATLALGGLVFLAAYLERLTWLDVLVHSPLALTCLGVVALLVPLIAYSFAHGHAWWLRIATGAQLACILVGFCAAQAPALVRLQTGDLTMRAAAAPPATFSSLLVAVVVGLSAILPATVYLIRVYKPR